MGIGFSARALLRGLIGGRAPSLGRARHWRGELFRGMEGLEGRVMLSGYTFSTLETFKWTNSGPFSSPYGEEPNVFGVDGNGDVFGTTEDRQEILEISASGQYIRIPFANENILSLTVDRAGNVYGTTGHFGNDKSGRLFEIAQGTTAAVTLVTFSTERMDELAVDGAGNLYGFGVTSGYASIYEVVKGSGTMTQLASFGSTGDQPNGSPVVDSDGNLYVRMDEFSNDVIYELTKQGDTLETVATFPQNGGVGLAVDSAGDLFGATYGGGAFLQGSIFEVEAGSRKFVTLASLVASYTGTGPSQVLVDSDGDVFCTTSHGASTNSFQMTSGNGALIEIPAGTHGAIVLRLNSVDTVETSPGIAVDESGDVFSSESFTDNSSAPFAIVASSTTIFGSPLDIFRPPLEPPAMWRVFELQKSSATHLSFSTQPANAKAGDSIQVVVNVEDADGNVVAGDHSDVTLESTNGATLAGTTTVKAVDGVATFEISVDKVGSYLLEAKDSGFVANSSSFEISVASVSKLGFLAGGVPTPGNLIYPSVRVAVEDAFGNVEPNDDRTVVLSTVEADGTPGPSLSANAVDGIADFNGLILSQIGQATLTASDGVLAAVETIAVNQPYLHVEDADLSTGIDSALTFKVDVVSGNSGVLVQSDHSTMNLSISRGPPGGVLGGTTEASAINGVATFGDVTFSTVGVYYIKVTDGSYGTGYVDVFVASESVTQLADIGGMNGSRPVAGMVTDVEGNLYGVTSNINGGGTVFELSKGSDVVTTLATISGANGSVPQSSLVIDSQGNLYGTVSGGQGVAGSVFELAKGSHTIVTLGTFSMTVGHQPQGRLVIDPEGNLFGMTSGSGPNSDQTLFEVIKGRKGIATVTTFTSDRVAGSLSVDENGNIYGETIGGGRGGSGSIFEVVKNGGRRRTAYAMKTLADYLPDGPILVDPEGNLFFSSGGEVCELVRGSRHVRALTGHITNLGSSLVMDSNGDIFGTSYRNDATEYSALGTIFEIPRGSDIAQTVAIFDDELGAASMDSLLSDSLGNIYGETSQGGNSGLGSVFMVHAPQATAVATKVVFEGQPSGIAGSRGTWTVGVMDKQGNPITSGSYSITLSLISGPKGAVRQFTPLTVETVDGVATFDDVALSSVPGSYVFTANDWGVTAATAKLVVKKVKAVKLAHG